MACVTIAGRVVESRILISPRLGQWGGGGNSLAAAAPERSRLCKVEGPVTAATFSTIPTPHRPQPQTWSGAMGPVLLLGWGSLGEKEGECHSRGPFGIPSHSFPRSTCALAGIEEWVSGSECGNRCQGVGIQGSLLPCVLLLPKLPTVDLRLLFWG